MDSFNTFDRDRRHKNQSNLPISFLCGLSQVTHDKIIFPCDVFKSMQTSKILKDRSASVRQVERFNRNATSEIVIKQIGHKITVGSKLALGTYEEYAVSYRVVFRWAKQFRDRRKRLENRQRSGRRNSNTIKK